MPYFHDDFNDAELERIHQQELIKSLKKLRAAVDVDKLPVNSVKNLGAQFAGLSGARTLRTIASTLDNVLSVANKEQTGLEKAIIELQLLYGLRITEVLQIKNNDITYDGAIIIKGLKGSSDRIVYPVNYKHVWIRQKEGSLSIPDYLNRFYFYRLYKKKGIYQTLRSNKKASVTHLMRYIYISKLLEQDISLDQIRQLIGHKSIKSSLHYVNRLLR